MVPLLGRVMGSVASGGSDNCHMAGEHMHITNLFSVTLLQDNLSSKFLPHGCKFQMLGYWITGSLLSQTDSWPPLFICEENMTEFITKNTEHHHDFNTNVIRTTG
jgi:hypothetical protein